MEDDIYSPPQSDPIPREVAAAGAGGFRYTVDPHGLTKFVVIMLWVTIIGDTIAIFSDLGQMALLSNPAFTDADAASNNLRQQMVGYASILIYLVTGIPFLMWIYRANKNSHGFGANITTTPGWSVGWYFIPIANLFKPFQVMKEIWQASLDPHQWPLQRSTPLLAWWWGLWIFGGILGQVMLRMPAVTIPELQASTITSMIVGVESIAVSIVAMKLLKAIIRNQDRLVNGE